MPRRLLNIPNMLTALRILMLPLLAWAIDTGEYFYGIWLVTIIGSTDILDGWIARRYGWQTAFGKLIDPVADKLMICVMVVYLVAREPGFRGDPPLSALAGTLLLGREFLITGLRAWTASFGLVIPADRMGKLKAFAQNIGLGFVLYGGHPTFYLEHVGIFNGPEQGIPAHEVGVVIVWLSIILSYWSMLRYMVHAWVELKKRGLAAHEA